MNHSQRYWLFQYLVFDRFGWYLIRLKFTRPCGNSIWKCNLWTQAFLIYMVFHDRPSLYISVEGFLGFASIHTVKYLLEYVLVLPKHSDFLILLSSNLVSPRYRIWSGFIIVFQRVWHVFTYNNITWWVWQMNMMFSDALVSVRCLSKGSIGKYSKSL